MIIERVRKGGYPSTRELADYCKYSYATIKRDIEYIKAETNGALNFCHKRRGWKLLDNQALIHLELDISQRHITGIRMGLYLIKQYDYLPMFSEGMVKALQEIDQKIRLSIIEEEQQHIYFEPIPSSPSAELFEFFLDAIEDQAEVCFSYQSFKNLAGFYYVAFQPYALKEYNNRWYVVGYSNDPEHNSINALAIDRVTDKFKRTGNRFEPQQGFDMRKHFAHNLGMTVDTNKDIETIELEFEEIQGKYFASKPFHQPYRVASYHDDGCTPKVISMRLRQNFELVRKLVEMGAGVKVLAPESLITKVKKKHQAALDQYE